MTTPYFEVLCLTFANFSRLTAVKACVEILKHTRLKKYSKNRGVFCHMMTVWEVFFSD